MLVFSQWTKMLDIIGALMEDMGLKFLRLDGSTPVRERQKLIDLFEQDKKIPIFILSTKAGGLGINLTAADTVIIHDLDFNPENDRQAEVFYIFLLYYIFIYMYLLSTKLYHLSLS